MKTLDKYKKKLKIWKWCNKHFGNAMLAFYVTTLVASFVIWPFAPFVGFITHIVSLSSIVVGGIFHIAYGVNTEYGIMLEKKVSAMENATPRSVQILEESIEFYKENPTQFKDAKSTKNLVKELIKVKKCAKKALEEQEEQEKNEELTSNM